MQRLASARSAYQNLRVSTKAGRNFLVGDKGPSRDSKKPFDVPASWTTGCDV